MNRLILRVLCITTVGVHLGLGQTVTTSASSNSNTPAPASTTATPVDLEQLRETIALQEEQIKRLQQAVDEQQKLLQKSLDAAKSVQPAAAATTADGTSVVATSNAAKPSLIPAVAGGRAPDPRQKPTTYQPSSLSITLGNTTLTPLGFMDATFFLRSTNVGSGIGTNFFAIPFNNVPAGHLSETNFSAQNSRLGFRVDSDFLGAKVLGYLEADFLFNNDSNSFQVGSNSAGFRLRNYFVDVQKNGFEILGGQDWSMLTPNRKGISPLPSDIFYTQNMDTNYQVGLVWTRAPQFRFIAHPNEDLAFGVALENPQQYIGGGSGAATVTLPANLNTALSPQFDSGQQATATPNLFPDIIFKGAYDAHAGDKLEHVEVAGLVSGFKDYVPISTPPAQFGSHTAVGFGGEVNANLELTKGLHAIVNTYFSDGGGRYLFGMGPDLIVRPSGDISPLKAFGTLDGFEAQVKKNTLLTVYYGGVYVGQNVAYDPTATGSTLAKPVYVGYGYPKSTSYRDSQEITFGWIQTLWKNPNYGALSLINQYSYLLKEPWYVAVGAPKEAHTNLIYIDLRYTLP